MTTEASPIQVNAIVNAASIEADKRKDARVDALVSGWEQLEKKIAAAEAEGPGSEWKVELHKQSIEVLKFFLKELAK